MFDSADQSRNQIEALAASHGVATVMNAFVAGDGAVKRKELKKMNDDWGLLPREGETQPSRTWELSEERGP